MMVNWKIGLMVFSQIMVFLINSDIVDQVIAGDQNAIEVIHQCVFAVKMGRHVVLINILDLRKLIDLDEIFTRQEIAVFLKLKSWCVSLGNLKQSVSVKVIVTYSKSTHRVKNEIYLNPRETKNFDFISETQLLTENLDDAHFFMDYLLPYYQRKSKIRHVRVNSRNLMGGGDTTEEVYKEEIKEEKRLILCITDSDYKYKGSTSLGSTASKVQRQYCLNPFNAGFYSMQYVREVENLIPHSIILNNTNLKHHFLIVHSLKFDFSYFDMKDGIKEYQLIDPHQFAYWKQEFANTPLESKLNRLYRDKLSSKETSTGIHKDDKFVDGFGSNILKQSIDLLGKNLPKVEDSDLSDSQRHEWFNIGREILCWCCCYEKIIL